jgi:RimJ/RimL family protein N-acetyltransferase
MVQLIKMDTETFQRFARHSAATYAQALEQAYAQERTSPEGENLLSNLLPQGLETPNHYLFTLHDDDGEQVGVLWYGIIEDDDAKTLFIYDFEIFPYAQRRGHAKTTLKQIQQWATTQGIQHLELNVFFDNHPARMLYDWFGMKPTEMTMTKALD